VLIVFTGLLLAVTPLTEYFWHFDNFLRGGQDLELGLLSLATMFALVLVLSHGLRRKVAILLAVRRWLAFGLPRVASRLSFVEEPVVLFHCGEISDPVLHLYTLPIQI
jgi:hypothetical protein